MTLIVSWAQEDMVLQLSDRRLSLPPRRRGEPSVPLRDPANKTVMFNGRILVGFTGRSLVEGEPTDRWIAKRLAAVGDDLDAAVDLLRTDLNDAFRRSDHRGHPMGIIISGFYYNEDRLRPFQGIISNRVGDSWRPPYSRNFSCHLSGLDDPEYSGLQVAPDWLTPGEIARLHESIPPGCNQFELVSRLARAIRNVADTHPEMGHDLMLASLPLSAAHRLTTYSISSGMPNLANPAFEYLSNEGESVRYAPTIVMAGQVIAGVTISREKPWTPWR